MKNKKLGMLSLAALLTASINANAFNSGDVITFDQGVTTTTCIISSTSGSCLYESETVTSGSYAAIDFNWDGVFSPSE